MKKKILGLVLTAVMITGIMSGCSNSSDKKADNAGTKSSVTQGASDSASTATDGELERIKKSGKLIVGINADYAPYGFHAKVDGKDTISGVDVEVAKEVAKDMGVKLELLESNFDMLLSELQAGQCDVVISCLSPTSERKKQIDFSDMYSQDRVVAMIRKEDASLYNKFDDLKTKKIGCSYGTIQETLVKKLLPDNKAEYREGMTELFLELQAKQVDAVVSTESVCKMAIASNPDLAIANGSEFDTTSLGMDQEGAAVGVRKNSQSVIDSVNATIKRMSDAGDMEKIMDDACVLAAKNAKK